MKTFLIISVFIMLTIGTKSFVDYTSQSKPIIQKQVPIIPSFTITYGIGRVFCPWTDPILRTDKYDTPMRVLETWPVVPGKEKWILRKYPQEIWGYNSATERMEWLDKPNTFVVKCGTLRDSDALNPERTKWRCGWCDRIFSTK